MMMNRQLQVTLQGGESIMPSRHEVGELIPDETVATTAHRPWWCLSLFASVVLLSPWLAAGVTPISPGGAIVIGGILNTQINNIIPNTMISITPDGFGGYNIGGTLKGYAISPSVPLYIGDDTWIMTSGTAGGSTKHNGIGGVLRITLWSGLKFNGEMAKVIIHELLHSHLAQCYPGFAADPACNGCEHQFVFSVTASTMCDMAQNCSMTLTERQDAQTNADIDNKKCEELSNAMVCDNCSQEKPLIPPCPGPCSLPECN